MIYHDAIMRIALLRSSRILFVSSETLGRWQAVAGAECNTVIELKLEHHAA